MTASLRLLGLVCIGSLAAPGVPPTVAAADLICCGGEHVDVVRLGERDGAVCRVWTWRAADSAAIPVPLRDAFRTTDECKPYDGGLILITSSAGGVALVRREDRRCLFHTSAVNAHSACLLPGRRVAVAASTGGDALLVFDRDRPGCDVPPLAREPLQGAHGACWRPDPPRLWALGEEQLLSLVLQGDGARTSLAVDRRFRLPTFGGHDLSPTSDGSALFITTGEAVYRFDPDRGTFAADERLGELSRVKSVDQHPSTGEIVFHRATPEHWWSDTIRFVAPERTVRLEGERLYKVRWDVPRRGT